MFDATGICKRYIRRIGMAEKIMNGVGAEYRDTCVRAVEDVALSVEPGEVLALVGESGCGKSTLGRVLAGVSPPSEGTVTLNGQDLYASTPAARAARLDVQMVFQDPLSSLNPRMTIRRIVMEAAQHHGRVDPDGAEAHLARLLGHVGLHESYANRYPHQFSGGQRQRIGIARALSVSPKVLICDEAVSALDVSVQAQVINLLSDLVADLGLAMIFISHDLSVVHQIADRVAIMYLGRIVETGTAEQIFDDPRHPYTKLILSQMPVLDPTPRVFRATAGEVPSAANVPPGCAFASRCTHVTDLCRTDRPLPLPVAPGRIAACHFAEGADGALPHPNKEPAA